MLRRFAAVRHVTVKRSLPPTGKAGVAHVTSPSTDAVGAWVSVHRGSARRNVVPAGTVVVTVPAGAADAGTWLGVYRMLDEGVLVTLRSTTSSVRAPLPPDRPTIERFALA